MIIKLFSGRNCTLYRSQVVINYSTVYLHKWNTFHAYLRRLYNDCCDKNKESKSLNRCQNNKTSVEIWDKIIECVEKKLSTVCVK